MTLAESPREGSDIMKCKAILQTGQQHDRTRIRERTAQRRVGWRVMLSGQWQVWLSQAEGARWQMR